MMRLFAWMELNCVSQCVLDMYYKKLIYKSFFSFYSINYLAIPSAANSYQGMSFHCVLIYTFCSLYTLFLELIEFAIFRISQSKRRLWLNVNLSSLHSLLASSHKTVFKFCIDHLSCSINFYQIFHRFAIHFIILLLKY